MNDVARAIELLRQARDILVARLTQRIVDAGDELLEDAQGNSYSAEIEAIYDQVGLRLANVNALLSNLQLAQPASLATSMPVDGAAPLDAAPLTGSVVETVIAAAPSESTVGVAASDDPPVASFEWFARQIGEGDLYGAGRTLSVLFELSEPRAAACAARFAEKLTSTPDFLAKAKQLSTELHRSVNGSLMLLWECFGLQGPESLRVLSVLRNRFPA